MIGQTWDVEWVPINDPEAVTTRPCTRASRRAARRFRRLEGCWWGTPRGTSCRPTAAGVRRAGVRVRPVNETLKLIYASPTAIDCDNPDNITVTPRGGLLLCEDAAGGTNILGERMVGLTLDGNTFTFAQNNVVLTARRLPRQGNGGAGRLPQPGIRRGLLQPGRKVAVRQHPDAGDHVRDHRPLGKGTALTQISS